MALPPHSDPSRKLEELLELFNPATGKYTCVGNAPSKHRRCQNRIAERNRQFAKTIVSTLPQCQNDGERLRARLEEIASATLCLGVRLDSHQFQAKDVAQVWHRKIIEAEISRVRREIEELHGKQQERQRAEEEHRRQEEEQERQRRTDKQERQRQDEERRRREEEQDRRRQDKEHRRQKEEQERQRRKKEQERQRQDEERRRQEEEQEHRRQDEERRRQEDNRQRQEEARRRREARQRADAQARAERERLQRERLAQAWSDSWARYERGWNHMRRIDTSDFKGDVRDILPWPVKSGIWHDVDEVNVKSFFRHAPDGAAENPLRFGSLLRRMLLKWHEDKLLHFFRGFIDKEVVRLATLVTRVIYDLKGTLSSL